MESVLLSLREHFWRKGILVRPVAKRDEEDEAPFVAMGNMFAAMRFGG